MKLKLDTTIPKKITVELLTKEGKSTLKINKDQQLGSQVLLPTIVEALKKQKIKFKDLSEVEVNPGPGSFTGTRVGVSVANAIGFALDIPVNGKKGKIVLPIYEESKFDG